MPQQTILVRPKVSTINTKIAPRRITTTNTVQHVFW
jgi:hypothetical protein